MSDPKEGESATEGVTNLRGENEGLTPRERSLANLRPFQPGNPGRPKGAKNRFVENFWRDLQKVWQEEGLSCLYRVAKDMPDKFILAAANKIPGEVEVTSNTYVIGAPEASTSTQEWLDSLSVRRPDQTIQ
jgi:hypothetical protein